MRNFSSYTWIPNYSKPYFPDHIAVRVSAERVTRRLEGTNVRVFLVPKR